MNRVVFVFGSNLAGRHGAGAALHSHKHWGAQYGVGEGLTGNAYALPTKDRNIKTLPLAHFLCVKSARWWLFGLVSPQCEHNIKGLSA